MSQIYKVCTTSGSANAVINMSNSSCASTWTNYTVGDCNVYEKRKTLTFSSNTPSSVSYRIYYSYTVTYMENYQVTGTQVFFDNVTMPAGATSVTKQVLCDYYLWCSSGDIITERGEFSVEV